jgi:hypothetical protein
MFRNRRYLIWLLVWGAAVYVSLMIYFIPGEFSHSICGPWGCYPDIQPLAALHTAWLAGIILPAVLAARSLPVRWARRLGWATTALGAMGLAVVTCREALTWLPEVPEEWRGFFHLRMVYTVAMLVDVPLLQLVLAGIVICVIVRLRYRPLRVNSAVSRPDPVAEPFTTGIMNGSDTTFSASPNLPPNGCCSAENSQV